MKQGAHLSIFAIMDYRMPAISLYVTQSLFKISKNSLSYFKADD